MSVIAICNQKGGVGKTTTAVSLAACLAAAERRTLLVDMDPQANAGSGFGIDKNAISSSVYDLLIGQATIDTVCVETELGHLHIIPSNINLVGAEIELASDVSRETRLTSALASIRDKYDYILIDAPPSLGLLTINALTAADWAIIPVQCEYYAMMGMTDLMKTIELINAHLNPKLRLMGILLTMFDGRNNLARQVSEEIRTHFQDQVFASVIPRNVRLSEAPSHGRPIILYDIRSIGAERYLQVAQEVMTRAERAIPREESQRRSAYDATTEGIGEGTLVTDIDEARESGANPKSEDCH
ncbi:MAG: ParA family protein [Deltaproteobacteria bacterium]|nr:ParA family protein [Deltaproteobacteria bacterium]